MRTGMVEVLDVLLDAVAQMPFAQDKQAVQAFPPKAAQKTLAVCVGARSVMRRVEHLDPSPARDAVKRRAILAVIVADQEPWSLTERRCFPQLLGYPALAGMPRDREMHHPSGRQFDDDKDKQVAKPEVMQLQEITGPDGRGMVVQEGEPGLAAWACPRPFR